MGLAMMPSTTAGMNAVPQQLVGRASALSNVIRQVAGSLGITVISTILQNSQVASFYRLSEQVSMFNPASLQLVKMLQGWFGQYGISGGESQGLAIGTLYGDIQKQAFVDAMNDTMFVTFLVAEGTVILGFMIKDNKKEKSGGESHVMIE